MKDKTFLYKLHHASKIVCQGDAVLIGFPATKPPGFFGFFPTEKAGASLSCSGLLCPKGSFPSGHPMLEEHCSPLIPLPTKPIRFLWMLPSKKNDMSRKMLISFFFVEENRLSMNHLCQQSKEISERWLRLFLTRKSNAAFPFQ